MKASRHEMGVDAQLRQVASLSEPVRRTLYRYVAAQAEPVSREQAAAGVQVPHHVAKFHLDRLEQDGLLEVEYRRPAGRSGPGAGRPAKFYRRAAVDVAVSVPERRYDLAGRLMAEAITTSAARDVPITEALRRAAHSTGRSLGRAAASRLTPRSGPSSVESVVCEVLEEHGYEPSAGRSCITLTNCPFHSLAADYTGLVCGMNLDLVAGLLAAVGGDALEARLDPADGRCCVTLTRSARRPVVRR